MSDAPQSPTPPVTLSVQNQSQDIEQAQSRVVQDMERHGYPKASLFAVRLALHEAMSNAFAHGHKNMPDAPVTLQFSVSPQQAEITVKDQGPGFDPASIPDPTLDENLERGCGRGLLLIRAYMTSAEYNDKGNALQMVYKRPSGA
jgi:serine/threonine-protein kinase RsbW